MSPLLLLLGSLGFSLAFNVSWAWGGPPLSVIAAAACTLIVPAGLHLWPQIPVASASRGGELARRAVRAVVMSGICIAAAVTSFAHAVGVLEAAGWADWTAASVTGGAELLVALSTMALRTPVPMPVPAAVQEAFSERVQPPDTSVQPLDVQAQDVADRPVQPRADTPRKLVAVDSDRSARFHAWVATLPERPSQYAVRQEFGCRQSVAKSLLAELDEDDDSERAERTS